MYSYSFFLSLSIFAQGNDIEQTLKTGKDLFYKQKYLEALPYLEDAANNGNDEAQFYVGLMFEFGYGVSINYEKAIQWYKKSVERGNPIAQNRLGEMYAQGVGVEANYSEALALFEKSSSQNYPKAFTNIGYMYYIGSGVDKDYKRALDYFLKAANQGEVNAQTYLGIMYSKGYGVNTNAVESAKWYQKAAEQGNNQALYNLGIMNVLGQGVKQDYKKAVNLFLQAAENNYAPAQAKLGYMYENGMGVKKNYSTAIKWYRKAIEQGEPKALIYLGEMYFLGKGVKKDYSEAAWLIQQAAQQGDAMAMGLLGTFYENGEGVQKDLVLAVKWYCKALVVNPNEENAKNGYMRLKQYMPVQNEEASNPPKTTEPQDESHIDASGTGFLIDKRGYLATNYHVTKGANDIYVCLQIDGVWNSYNAVLVKNDPTNDLSIMRIDDLEFKPFTSLPYNFSTEVEDVASDIYTLGYPQVHIMGTEVKYTTGAINSKSGVQGDPTHYQISAHIDYGNSGGPMFNSKGTIIGITDSGLDKAEFGDVNYAIKSSYLKSLVDALPIQLELPHDTSIEKLSRVEQIKVLSKYTALILIDLP